MVSGANLSDTYFRARQDRYVIFRSKPVAGSCNDGRLMNLPRGMVGRQFRGCITVILSTSGNTSVCLIMPDVLSMYAKLKICVV